MSEIPIRFSSVRYLAAKQGVDDRSLNRGVWDRFAKELRRCPPPVRLLEVGGGIGAMVERLLSRAAPPVLHYTLLDQSPRHVAEASARLPARATARGFRVDRTAGGYIYVWNDQQEVVIETVAADIFDFASQAGSDAQWDVLVAQAFLDLVPLEEALTRLSCLLSPEGLFYFPGHFDGETVLEPVLDAALDAHLIRLYHQSMDRRSVRGLPVGGSRTGRRLVSHLRSCERDRVDPGAGLAVGGSDWIVVGKEGGYPGDEAYFLHHLLHFFEVELTNHPLVDPGQLAGWLSERHAQVIRGELRYRARQLDVAGRLAHQTSGVKRHDDGRGKHPDV